MRGNNGVRKRKDRKGFTVRIDHGDDLILELIKLAELEKIESAVFMLLGALKEGKLVAGRKKT